MSKTGYKRLGDYIREVDVRNRDLEVKELVGLTINKAFIPSVANTIGTDLSNYKVIRKEQFACSLMQVSRDGKMPIAMFEGECAIMSPAYPMFEVVDKNILLPQYLMMWFSRNEFDREASFYAVGGVRGSLTWQDFCDMTLPIPSIEQQRKIVAEYETISNRIRLNEQMITHLEETAQTLYRKMFVDGIDKENLPEGWRMGTLGEIAEINPRLILRKNEKCSFVEMDALPTEGFGIKKIAQKLYSGGTKFQNNDVLFARITPCMENGKAAVVKTLSHNEIAAGSTEFIILRGKDIQLTGLLSAIVRNQEFKIFAKKRQTGSDGRQRVEAESLRSFPMVIPSTLKLKNIESMFYRVLSHSLVSDQENKLLIKLQFLLLAKMGQ